MALSEADKAKIDELFDLLSLRAEKMKGWQLRKAREAEGLSISQAAPLLQTTQMRLMALENDHLDWVIAKKVDVGSIYERMNEVYKLGNSAGKFKIMET